jgi:hypothetical protein
MIAFVTSFRARALARDWDYHAWLLEQTVRSMLSQRAGEIRVFVGCHESPSLSIAADPRVSFVQVAVPPPERNNDDMCVDKVLKLSAGTERAIAQGCRYVIFNDADDLVSNRIGEFVAAHCRSDGWYAAAEMFYTYGGRLLRHFDIPGGFSGPCVIVRSDLLRFAEAPYSGYWTELIRGGGEARYLALLERHRKPVSVLAAVGIEHYRALMEHNRTPLAPLPFPANIVINHADSTSSEPTTGREPTATGAILRAK